MLQAIADTFAGGVPFDVTLLVPDETVLKVIREAIAAVSSSVPFAFSWDREIPAGIVINPEKFSAIDAAIRYGNTVASVGRPTIATLAPFDVYEDVMRYDVKRWEAFNLNPHVNQGRQIDRLIAWTLNDPAEMAELVRLGVSGIITDDIPTLRNVVDAAGVPR